MLNDNDLLNSLQTESLNFYNKTPDVNPHHRTANTSNTTTTHNKYILRQEFNELPTGNNTANYLDFADTAEEIDPLYEQLKQQIKDKATSPQNNTTKVVDQPKKVLSEYPSVYGNDIEEVEEVVEDAQVQIEKGKLVKASNFRKATSCESCVYFSRHCICAVLDMCVSEDNLCDNYVNYKQEGDKKRQELLEKYNLNSVIVMDETALDLTQKKEETPKNSNIPAPEQITNDSNDINKEDIEGLLTYSDQQLWNESVSEITNLDIPLEEKAVKLTTSYINKYTNKYGTKEGAYKKIDRTIN